MMLGLNIPTGSRTVCFYALLKVMHLLGITSVTISTTECNYSNTLMYFVV
jgi:hypothetical protein